MAVTYAVRNPDRVSHLILDDTQARTEDFFNVPQMRVLDQLTSEWEAFLEYLAFQIYGVGRADSGPVVEFLRACVTPETLPLISEAARHDDVTALLPQIGVPTLIVQHAGVSKQHVEAARDMAASISNGRLVMLGGGPTAELAKIIRAIGDLLGTEAAITTRSPARTSPAASGVRTILFTDIVGHTGMMQRLGDKAGREVLREHEELTREVLRTHGGDEVKTMGDGFMASFGSVTKAVECAVALQRAMEARNEEPRTENLSVRVGLNAGEPIEEKGDLFGATVIMASRIASKAEGGEILVADTVRGLCSGKGFLFADRGEFVAKGFEEAVRVYEVRWRDG